MNWLATALSTINWLQLWILLIFLVHIDPSASILNNASLNGSRFLSSSDHVPLRNHSNYSIFNPMSIAIGSLINNDCRTDNDCILKNSVCNFYTKRCECDFNAIENQNRC
ncbi:cell cycle control protein 50A [Sarcoptes scabiei]|nr:cell cycle control protein 50A [Sarcoptes scabiei]